MFWKKPQSLSTQQQLQFDLECLEERQMLAGDVSVVFNAGVLDITGDDASNRIELVSDGAWITVTGQGTDLIGGIESSNGDIEPFQFQCNLVHSINIDLQDGNDRVTLIAENSFGIGFGGAEMNGDDNSVPFGGNQNELQIRTGDGNDRVTLIANNTSNGFPTVVGHGSTGFSMNMDIDTGDGNDRLLFEANNSNFTGFDVNNWQVATGEGNDRVNYEANNSDFSRGFIARNFNTSTEGGNDRVEFDANNTGEESTGFQVGFISDAISIVGEESGWFVNTGNGNDRLTIEANNPDFTDGFRARNFNFYTGEGNDRVSIVAENEGRSTGFSADRGYINTGGGADRLAIDANNSGFRSTGISIEEELTIATDNNFGELAGDFEDSIDGRDRVDLTAGNDGGVGFDFNFSNDPVAEGHSSNGTLRINTGGEDDRVNITASNTGSMDSQVGGFQDAGFSLREFILNTGSDDDHVQVRGNNRGGVGFSVSDYVFVGTAQGDDDVNITVGRDFGIDIPFYNTQLDGGEDGDDRLRTNFYIPSNIHNNFEDFPVFDLDEN